jgi:small subunit ribosomal protein S14
MAKLALINREAKRVAVVAKFAAKRAALLVVIKMRVRKNNSKPA